MACIVPEICSRKSTQAHEDRHRHHSTLRPLTGTEWQTVFLFKEVKSVRMSVQTWRVFSVIKLRVWPLSAVTCTTDVTHDVRFTVATTQPRSVPLSILPCMPLSASLSVCLSVCVRTCDVLSARHRRHVINDVTVQWRHCPADDTAPTASERASRHRHVGPSVPPPDWDVSCTSFDIQKDDSYTGRGRVAA